MHRSPVVRPVAALCLVLAAIGVTSCADGHDDARSAAVEPVAAPAPPVHLERGRPEGDLHDRDDRAALPTAPETDTDTDTTTASDDAARSLVQTVLDRYDAALTTVAADPLAATRQVDSGEGQPGLAEWHSAVVEGGSFSTAMLAELVDRATHESTVVRPGPDGRSYRHLALQAVADGDRVSFTWCGHAPGLGIDTTTGEVVDDAVALSHGTGELRYEGSQWRLLTLDAFDLDVAAPGTPDPCPGEVAATGAAR